MGNQLDLYQLRALHAFAQVGSFAGAAQRLHLTQSAISHAIRKLEASAGVPLVIRHGSKVQLTEDGVHLCEACEAVFLHPGQRGRGPAQGRLPGHRAGCAWALRWSSAAASW